MSLLWKSDHLREFALRATDGVIGKLAELFFSDDSWTVRYLVVKTGDWLDGREVLVSPMALDVPNAPAKVIPVSLTLEQVESSPPVDTQKPVSRQFEARFHDFYGWPYYWMGEPAWGPFPTPGELARAASHALPDFEASDMLEDPHLRSTDEVEGYRFEGTDGKLGHIEDFVVSDQSWSIRYLEIDTRHWWPGGKKVLLATSWVSDVSWKDRRLKADVSRDKVKQAPEYDGSAPITEAFEIALAEHYGLTPPVETHR